MPARRSPDGDVWFVQFPEGEDLHQAYRGFAREQGLASGVVLAGIGMLRDPVLGFYDGQRYHQRALDGMFELVSTQGNIALLDGAPFTHLHVTVAGADHVARGGHLFGGKVCISHEGAVRALPDVPLRRARLPGTELAALVD